MKDWLESQRYIVEKLMWVYEELESIPVKEKWVELSMSECAFLLKDKAMYKLMVMEGFINGIEDVEVKSEKYESKAHNINAKNQKIRHERRKERQGEFSMTAEQWKWTLECFNNRCAYCGSDEKSTYDHFIPFSKGGKFELGNIVPACASCNASKNNNSFGVWYKKKDFYNEKRKQNILDFTSKHK